MTILGHRMAREGVEFKYRGLVDACHPCSLRKVCHQLDEGRVYQVTRVRDVRHKADACGVFEGDVVVADVEEVPPIASIPRASARGTGTRWNFIECEHPCSYKRYCQQDALRDGERVEIVERLGPPDRCPKGLDLMLARLRPQR